MKLITLALLVLVAALTIATAANAAPALRIIGNASSSGDFAVTAANAEKDNAAAIYVRGTGRGLSGFGAVACSRAHRQHRLEDDHDQAHGLRQAVPVEAAVRGQLPDHGA